MYCSVGLESLLKGFIYFVYAVYDVCDVTIRGVFAFDELSFTSVCVVDFEFAVGPECVADSSNNVWFMMCGSVLCKENVLRYNVACLPVCLFVVL